LHEVKPNGLIGDLARNRAVVYIIAMLPREITQGRDTNPVPDQKRRRVKRATEAIEQDFVKTYALRRNCGCKR
jgi:hypothetical protein